MFGNCRSCMLQNWCSAIAEHHPCFWNTTCSAIADHACYRIDARQLPNIILVFETRHVRQLPIMHVTELMLGNCRTSSLFLKHDMFGNCRPCRLQNWCSAIAEHHPCFWNTDMFGNCRPCMLQNMLAIADIHSNCRAQLSEYAENGELELTCLTCGWINYG